MNVARNSRPRLTNNGPSCEMHLGEVSMTEPGDPEPNASMEPQERRSLPRRHEEANDIRKGAFLNRAASCPEPYGFRRIYWNAHPGRVYRDTISDSMITDIAESSESPTESSTCTPGYPGGPPTNQLEDVTMADGFENFRLDTNETLLGHSKHFSLGQPRVNFRRFGADPNIPSSVHILPEPSSGPISSGLGSSAVPHAPDAMNIDSTNNSLPLTFLGHSDLHSPCVQPTASSTVSQAIAYMPISTPANAEPCSSTLSVQRPSEFDDSGYFSSDLSSLSDESDHNHDFERGGPEQYEKLDQGPHDLALTSDRDDGGSGFEQCGDSQQDNGPEEGDDSEEDEDFKEDDDFETDDEFADNGVEEGDKDFELVYHDVLQDGNIKDTEIPNKSGPRDVILNMLKDLTCSGTGSGVHSYGVFGKLLAPKSVFGPNCERVKERLEIYLAVGFKRRCAVPMKRMMLQYPTLEYRSAKATVPAGPVSRITSKPARIALISAVGSTVHCAVHKGITPCPRDVYYCVKPQCKGDHGYTMVNSILNDTALAIGESRDDLNIIPKEKSQWYGSGLTLITSQGEFTGSDLFANSIPHKSHILDVKVADHVEGVLYFESGLNAERVQPLIQHILPLDLHGFSDRASRSLGVQIHRACKPGVVFGYFGDYNGSSRQIYLELARGHRASVHENDGMAVGPLRFIGLTTEHILSLPKSFRQKMTPIQRSITKNLIANPDVPRDLVPDMVKMLELGVTVEVEAVAKEYPDFYYHIIMSGMESLTTSPKVELAPFYQPVEPMFTSETLDEISMFDLRVLEPDQKYPNCIRFHFLSDGKIVGNRLLTLFPDGSITVRNGNTHTRRRFSQEGLKEHVKPEDVKALADSYQYLLAVADRSSCESRKKVFYDCIERLTKVATVLVKHNLPADTLEESLRPSHKDLAKAELLAHFLLGHCISAQLCPVCKKSYVRLGDCTRHLIASPDCMREASEIPPNKAPADICSRHPDMRWCPVPKCKKREFESPADFEHHRNSEHPANHECPVCSKSYVRLGDCRKHWIANPDCMRGASEIPPDDAPADICSRHPEKRWCPVPSCEKQEFESPADFENHRISEHPDRHECPVCPKSYLDYTGVTRHLIASPDCMREASEIPPDNAPADICSRHPEKRWCPVLSCEKREFESPADFEHHRNSEHPNKYECPVCPKSYMSSDTCIRHIIANPDCMRGASEIPPDDAPADICSRHPEKRWCPVPSCEKQEFESPADFEHHRISEHPGRHECPVCPKSYQEYTGVTRHLFTSPDCMREASEIPPDDAPADICSRHPEKRWCPVQKCKKREFESPADFENHCNSNHRKKRRG